MFQCMIEERNRKDIIGLEAENKQQMILERYKHIRIPKPLMAVTVGEGQGILAIQKETEINTSNGNRIGIQ